MPRIERIRPPRPDIDRDPGIDQGGIEPGVVTRPQGGDESAVDIEPMAVAGLKRHRTAADAARIAGLSETVTQPHEEPALGVLAPAGIEVASVVSRTELGARWIPGNRVLGADPPDELCQIGVVTGTDIDRRGRHRHPGRLSGRELDVARGRM